jgi:hypothetical protein
MTAYRARNDELLKILRYDPETGELHRTDTDKHGNPIGCKCNGYVRVMLNGYYTYAHSIVWRLHYGYWPRWVHFYDGNGYNTRVENLFDRPMPKNIISKGKGFIALARVAGVVYPMGPYPTIKAAHKALYEAQNRV